MDFREERVVLNAQGILMARHEISPDRARRMLLAEAETTGCSLFEVAERVVGPDR